MGGEMKKFIAGLATVVFMVGIISSSQAATFYDDFEDPNFTNDNWLDGNDLVRQLWDFVPLSGSDQGWRSTIDEDFLSTQEPAAKIADNGREYCNAGLHIEVSIRLDSHAYVYSTEFDKILLGFSAGDGGNYLVTIRLKFDVDSWRGLLYFGTHGVPGQSLSDENLVEDPVEIEFDEFYKLVVQVDSEQTVYVSLYNENNEELGSVSHPKVLNFDKGAVGIGGIYVSTFNDFFISSDDACGDPCSGSVTTEEMFNNLINQIVSLNLHNGISNSLIAKLISAEEVLSDINQNNDIGAVNKINALINAVEAQRGNKIDNEDADLLINAAQEIITHLTMCGAE